MVLCLKKRWLGDELLTLALLLSLLRPEGLELHSAGLAVTSSGLELALQRRGYGELGLLAPGARGRAKTLLLDPQQYQQELLEELLALGRFDYYNSWRPRSEHNNRLHLRREQHAQVLNEDRVSTRRGTHNYTAFLLTVETGGTLTPAAPAEGHERSDGGSSAGQPAAAQLPPGDELSPEDMALIEVLWKQDVDLGVPLDVFAATAAAEAGLEVVETGGKETPTCTEENSSLLDCKPEAPRDQLAATSASSADTKGAAAETSLALESTAPSSLTGVTDLDVDEEEDEDGPLTSLDPWAGLPYTIDLETGEYVLREDEGLGDAAATATSGTEDGTELDDSVLPSFDHFSLEEALKIVGLDDKEPLGGGEDEDTTEEVISSDPVLTSVPQVKSEVDEADEGIDAALSEMMQTHPHHHHHHHHHQQPPHHMYHHPGTHHRPSQLQGRVPLVRAVSMEQRWQDLAQLLTGPSSSMPPPPTPLSHNQSDESTHFQSLLPPPQTSSFPHAGAAYPPHPHPDPRGVLLHNATLAPPMGDLNSSAAYSGLSALGNSHLGSAVATSMNLTNSSEPMGPPEQSQQGYKMESTHDMMYYQNGTGSGAEPLNHTADGFLSSILNDEDLQLMDMAMNEGMYTMRLLEGSAAAGTGVAAAAAAGLAGMPPGDGDGSSDSAVSSMGSERGGAWVMEPHSATSPNDPTSPYLEYGPQHGAKYRPYDYSNGAYSRQPASVAQKKHHMFGKRFFQEQSNATALPTQPGSVAANVPSPKMEMKFSCSLEFARHHAASAASISEARVDHVAHNHSYHLPSLPESSSGTPHRPLARDKGRQGRRGHGGPSSVSSVGSEEESHMTRDEKRARAMNVPITVDDIINLPMDEFNERLSKYDLTEAQLSLIRDIRRRGKNKVAAQNCRKRKLDQILSLADEVKLMRDRKNRLLRDKESMLAERQRLKEKFGQLYRHVFQALRDPDGRPYSPYEYSLQQSADGSVLLVPRGTPTGLHPHEESSKPPGPSTSQHQHQRRP